MRNDSVNMKRRHLAMAMGLLATGVAAPAFAQSGSANWPVKPVRIINPFPVGGGPDGVARLVADKLSRTWNQSVVVENRPGGNGFIAIAAFKQGATDGTDIIQLDNVHLAAYPHLFKKLPYDVQKDFEIITPLFRTYFFVCVPVNSPYQSVGDLIAAAKANPGKLNYGSWSVGNPVHLGSALLEKMTGTKMEHVIYKETSQLYQGVANGELDFALGSSGTAGPMVRAGKLRLLAIAAPERLPGYENVPTVAESGGPANYFVTGWNAFAVRPGTPAEVQRKLRTDVQAALSGPDVKEKFQTFGYVQYAPTPEEFKVFMAAESKRFEEVIKAAGLSLE
ncbi:tripartite-type tricarboxylate transporter receptor subunit TctC [Comamonas sp. BIGb0124]|uniref:Bug family tripartite tricarboxylate transporter substrate binding protein n=1 Tax=Comamonas sp. BIGb0124 TaxID=2485130 RepID=UPI000F480D89|nr:tripartite tricarboxylate transporter substrate binding protein [Comamonas sp. BIGb0124]ROR18501.1 tripartite-type tricarboxylate transporter receptor subunit TctC [Comamonas sp. BIGb0124]